MVEIFLEGCVCQVWLLYVCILDKQYNIPVTFFSLGINHKKLIFIYIIIPNVGGEKYLTTHVIYFTYTIPEGEL